MKCILIHRPGLLGTLVRIRRGLQLKTHEYLRTHWDSSIWHPRGSEAGPYILPYCTFSNFDLCHLLALPFFAPWFFSPSLLLFFSQSSNSFFCLTFACCLLFLWFLRAQKPLRQMKGWALVFPPLPLPCPASGLPVCGGDWDAVDDAAAGSSFALITPREPTMVWFGFLQPGRIFHISDVNASSNPPPYTFDQICTICLWREMNRLAGACFS